MVKVKVNYDVLLKLLEMNDADKIYSLIDNGREYLRAWLPWVDYNKCVDDSKKFIESALKQYGNSEGFQAGIW